MEHSRDVKQQHSPAPGMEGLRGEAVQTAAAMAWTGSRLTVLLAGNIPAAGTCQILFPGSGWISMVGKTCLPCLTTKFPCLQSTDTLG